MAIEVGNLAASLGSALGSGIGNFAEQSLETLRNKKLQEMLSQREITKSLINRLEPEHLERFLKTQGSLQNFLKGELGGGNLVGNVSNPQQDFFAALQNQLPISKEAEEMFGKGVDIPSVESLLGYKPQGQQLEAEPKKSIFAKTPQQERIDLEKKRFALEEKKFKQKQEQNIREEAQPFITQVNKEAKAAKEGNLILNKMEKLIEKGNLPPAPLYRFFKELEEKVSPTTGAAAGASVGLLAGGPPGAALGGGLGALVSPVASMVNSGIKYAFPDTEQFEKLSNSFIRGAKDIFGARVTNLDLETFLTTIPTLMQTDNGKKQIIKNMKVFNDAAEARQKAMREVIKENGGKLPSNYQEQIDEKASDELDKLAKEFIA